MPKQEMKAVILAGGLGKRLRPLISDRPKPLAEVQGKPVLQRVVEALREQGYRNLVFCVGVMGEQIEAHFGDGAALGVSIEYSWEDRPLGTAGAVWNARPRLPGPFLLLNGDCLALLDYGKMVQVFHARAAEAVIALVRVDDISSYGSVALDEEGRVVSFREKVAEGGPGLINAGAYVLHPESLFAYAGPPPMDLERQVFPRMIQDGRRVWGVAFEAPFVDIGTPERYREAQTLGWLR